MSSLLLQRLFDALSNGAVYAALALALTLVFRTTGVLNLAQGEMAMISAYVAALLRSEADPRFAFSDWFARLGTPWPVWAAVAAAVVFGALLGAVVHRLIMQPLEGETPLPQVGAALGLFLLINGLAFMWWGPQLRDVGSPFPNEIDDHVVLLGARLRYQTIGVVATIAAALGVLAFVQRRTKLGLAFRAVISNPSGARLVGIKVGSVLMIGWAVAAALGALGGGLIAGQLFVGPAMMSRLIVFALAAATLGGLGNPKGALVGGFALAGLETLLVGYVSFVTSDVALIYTLGILIIVLLVRPGGIFGTDVALRRAVS
ncbi:MAG: branched-chain amino acid ABC transporter permease [Acidimicrobiia bacterium]|nr:branched-chain amino acid ABC transporter permease [Acidimicrobiia bacterium]